MTTPQALFLGLALLGLASSNPDFTSADLSRLDLSKNAMYQLGAWPAHEDVNQASYNISSQCKAEVGRLIHGDVKTLENDIALALDAFGKVPAGIAQGNFAWLGHYDECMAIDGFNYCLVDMALNLTSLTKNSTQQLPRMDKVVISWGICPPANCTEQDILVLLEDFLGYLKILESIGIPFDALSDAGVICNKEPTIPYSAGFICTVTLCGFIASLMLIGALFDEYLKLKASWLPRQPQGIMSIIQRPLVLLNEEDEADDVALLSDVGPGSSINGDKTMAIKHNLATRLLLCFALNRNLAKLMDVKQGDASLRCLNGIRVISMFWVIIGHTVIFGFTTNTMDNPATFLNYLTTHPGFQAVANAFFSVDSFFFLSGFLLAYLTFNRFRELRTVKTWALFYFHRYWRLTPLFAFTILIYLYLPQFFGYGPLWQKMSVRPTCPDYWWSSLLYISNFWPKAFAQECIAWSWYLANDMQFFIISPLLMVPMFYMPVLGWLALIATLLASFLTTGLIIGLYDLDVDMISNFSGLTVADDGHDYFSLVYGKPYCRIAPYLVGLGLGYIMHRIGKRRVQLSPVLALIGWLAAAGMALSVVYGLYPSYHTPMSRAATIVYGTVSRFVWGLALAWVVYACKYGHGGWINSFLSWSAWVPLGRVTYSAYMVHPIVITVFYTNFATNGHFSVYLIAFYFAGCVSLSYFIAVFMALAIEYPFANLEKVLLPSLPPPRTTKVQGDGLAAREDGKVSTALPKDN